MVAAPTTVYPKDANANPAAVIVGTDGTLWNQALVDTDGAQKTRLEPASKATYCAATLWFVLRYCLLD